MKLYWVSLLIMNDGDSKPWLCPFCDGILDLDAAIAKIQEARELWRVLSAWIDIFDDNGMKSTVFHECYVDCLGNVKRE